MAASLYRLGQEVLAVDTSEERVQEAAPHVTHAVQADATDEEAMKALGIRNFDVVVVAIGELEASILATSVVKGLGVPCVVAKALSELHGRVLERVGANRVVFPERDMGIRVAHSLVSGNLIDYVELGPGCNIVEVIARQPFVCRSLKDLDFPARYGINILAIRRGNQVIAVPGADTVIEKGDVLVAMGEDNRLRAFSSSPIS